MKVTLPENISEVTLKQYQEIELIKTKGLSDEQFLDEVFKLFTGIENPGNVVKKDLDGVLEQILIALNTPQEFEPIFELDEVKYGFEPDLDSISAKQWAALQKYQSEVKDMHRLMSILFRPITKQDGFKNYSIEPFESTDKYCGKFLQMPMHVVNGAVGFFLNLQSELLNYILKSTKQDLTKARKEMKKRSQRRSVLWKNGAGTEYSQA